jgi:hypothetical protein
METPGPATNEDVAVEVFPGITMDPDIRFGKPCIAGTRVDVAMSSLRYAARVASHLPPAVREVS